VQRTAHRAVTVSFAMLAQCYAAYYSWHFINLLIYFLVFILSEWHYIAFNVLKCC